MQAANETGMDSAAKVTEEQQVSRVNVLLARFEEIKSMDKTAMNYAEKREIRKELNSIKRELIAQKKAATTGPIRSVMWIGFGAAIGAIVVLLFLLGAF